MKWLAENLASVEERICQACHRTGRPRESVTLIAVSKTFSLPLIEAAYQLGIREFGESKVQELLPKIEALPTDVKWHFIGKLQSNKVKQIVGKVSLIHTLDSPSQLKEINKFDQNVNALVEVNIAREPQKSGVLPENLAEFVDAARQVPNLNLRGLMTMGAANSEESETRQYFQNLRKLAIGDFLSMGMSGDFEIAIEEGATHVRVGSLIFGQR